MNKLLSLLITIFAGIILFAPTFVQAAAFGVSPPWIENENLKADSGYVYVIYLSANELAGNMAVKTVVSGDPEVQEWITVREQEELLLTGEQVQIPMEVEVNISKDAKPGKYNGNIAVSLVAEGEVEGENTVAVQLGANIIVNLRVIDHDVIDYTVDSITSNTVVEGQPLSLNLRIKNTGNTKITKVPVSIEVRNSTDQTTIIELEYDELSAPILPHTVGDVEMHVRMPDDLPAGDYWLKTAATKEGEEVYKNKLLSSVIAASSSEEGQSGPNIVEKIGKTVLGFGNKLIIALAILIIALAAIIAKIHLAAKKRKERK